MNLMSEPLIPAWSDVSKPIVGMLHAPPLPGASRHAASLDQIREHVRRDAEILVAGGVDGLLLENFGDAPFYPGAVPHYVVACLAALAADLRRCYSLPLGINVLRNDGCAALGIAHAVGAEFIRVNVLCGARLADQGIIHGIAHDLLRLRSVLGARRVKILADVNVKHSSPLAPSLPLEQEVTDLVRRGGADALIVSGSGTGQPTDVEELQRVKAVAARTPVWVGSGLTPANIRSYREFADGFIAGTALQRDGVSGNPVDPERVRSFVEAVKKSDP